MTASMRTLLHGEALVDLHCPRPVTALDEADAFVPHLGGAGAAVAFRAAQAGADVALAGVVGDDAWGRWLVERLAAVGVTTDRLVLDAGAATPLTFTLGEQERTTIFHGRPLPQLPGDALDADALVLGADTLATDAERDATLALRDRAAEAGLPVIVDARFTAHRWETPAFAASATRELVKGAFLVVAGAEEARLLSGEEHPAAAADGLVAMNAGHAIVVAPAGVVLRGAGLRLAMAGPRDHATLLGTVLAQLAGTDFYPPAIAVALR